ncbi:hypothetical protein Pden_1878 [Paracoccus denitrificans PD1222]|uniref:Uncharacterized protein n=1 Tax=Paracoccus denitrificans (strain Pd 1222) TaxID=318586 RepID=A1B379_PARDP|nr:hypothetical protein Pden_1878 [Paracoccus denitrificans PD1222]
MASGPAILKHRGHARLPIPATRCDLSKVADDRRSPSRAGKACASSSGCPGQRLCYPNRRGCSRQAIPRTCVTGPRTIPVLPARLIGWPTGIPSGKAGLSIASHGRGR